MPDWFRPLFGPGDRRLTINLKELSELSGIGIPTLRDWVRRGIILGAFQRKKSAKWRFRREPLEKWWEELMTRQVNPEAAQPKITRSQNEALDKLVQEKDTEIERLKARVAELESEHSGPSMKPSPMRRASRQLSPNDADFLNAYIKLAKQDAK